MTRPPRERAAPGFPPTLKRFGQHFLHDQRVLSGIVDGLGLTGAETVLEIGPGRGSLTDLLVDRVRQLVAIELDRALAELLRAKHAGRTHVRIVQGDVLELDLGELAGGPYVLVGNVPYYITTPILFHALLPPRPQRAVYLVQREVAERVVAAPGSKVYGALSVNVQAVARAEVLMHVPPGAFKPPPRVDSAVLRITPLDQSVVPDELADRFRRLVIASFGLRRKQMRRVLRTVLGTDADEAEALLRAAGIDPDARPETLSPSNFGDLMRVVQAR